VRSASRSTTTRLIGFTGVIKLIRNVGGVDVTLAEPYYDPYYWVNSHHRGWGLPAGKSHLDADDALIFARSRKGDSDFQRAKRQQQLVMAAVAKVRKRGLGELPKLLNIAKETVRTDLPIDRAADLFALYSTVDLAKVDRAVFGPKKFAVRNGGTDYKLVLNLCKQWIAHHFPPARPLGAWTRPRPRSCPRRLAPRGLLEGAGVDLVRDRAHPAHRGGAATLITLVVVFDQVWKATPVAPRYRSASRTCRRSSSSVGPCFLWQLGFRFLWVWAISQTGVPGVFVATIERTRVKCLGPLVM
jgi:hypothetical protein